MHYDGHESGVICAATRDQVEVCMLDVTREREQGRVTQELTWWQCARHMSKAESAVALGQDGGGRVPVASTPPFAASAWSTRPNTTSKLQQHNNALVLASPPPHTQHT